MRERVTNILERWFISEPALFRVLCTHSIEENTAMACPIRSGQRRIEYNPLFFSDSESKAIEQALMVEGVRILLRHPYSRRPDACSLQAATIGSNITIGDNYPFPDFDIERPEDYSLPKEKTYEWYARKIQEQLTELRSKESIDDDNQLSGDSISRDQKSDSESTSFVLPQSEGKDGNFKHSGDTSTAESPMAKAGISTISRHLSQSHENDSSVSELWDEDELSCALIVQIIENTKDWGSLTGGFAEYLKASVRAKINWRNVLSGFRASIISSKRNLTRMRPNRRSGFDNMGSIHRFETRVLVAVDVSGSISSCDLQYFYGVINSAFKYGISAIDVIEFDVGITSVISLKKVLKNVEVFGRGGTSFQEPIDYAHNNDYDGLIILTDGYAKKPKLPERMKCKIVWVCRDQACFDENHEWMNKIGRTCIMEI